MVRPLIYLILATAALGAEEIIVTKRPFTVVSTFEAGVIPTADCTEIAVRPELWTDFRILEIAEHGRRIRKGETLVRFDPAAIDAKLAAARAAGDETPAGLKNDRRCFEIRAAGDGWFYHGVVRRGHWVPRDLRRNGLVPLHEAFAMLVGDAARPALTGFADESTARALQTGLAGEALFAGREDLRVPVKVESVAAIPAADRCHRVDLNATWPAGFVPPVGATAQIHVVSHHQAQAIVIPTRALHFGPEGWCVEVKLAEGGTQRRTVQRGRAAGADSEILSGLEEGQLIRVP